MTESQENPSNSEANPTNSEQLPTEQPVSGELTASQSETAALAQNVRETVVLSPGETLSVTAEPVNSERTLVRAAGLRGGEEQKQATQLLSDIPFEHIIGGPLVAAVKAQGLASTACAQFIQEIAIERDNAGKTTNKVRTIQFIYQKNDKNVTLTVPLLTIVPIPFLRIDNMNINFKAKINAGSKSDEQTSASLATDLNIKSSWLESAFGLNFTGGISSKRDSTSSSHSEYSVEYTMDVNVHALQDAMPAGLQAVLNILTASITENTEKK
ncbi:DUF2589 domain-containing protein [Gloeothece verrucosa]|uniref:DUF2589 domain-containing protein n=1 Tax=Gloeothece verrucosa (strain PCC 7822) TaxID=497965 RepID=E0UFV2_GLOV7|nr:DUF2589 domain-containing protein [Gloeothece verrucosa]ADN14335.1 hypothetical protein Cyan7822_2357 [Gloeothece verrucosa PCC 7822]